MDIKKLWDSEKKLVDKCISHIKYDQVLADTLERLGYEIDKSVIQNFDCSPSIRQIIGVLENPRYQKDILSQATELEKGLVNELLNSLYMLDTSISYAKQPSKEFQTVSDTYDKAKGREKFPNPKESIDSYTNLWKIDDSKQNLTELKKLNKLKR